ncbi:DUF86 domain-containing protein [Sphingomonas sp. A2-49]|uniref:HepT-like ribonuclease domain-containing protein n=1 Tax=Sphingomonas sp. A2-49 TaxID=1391375 RepID=UPI0021CEFB1D|nr:HepT-like ribonuclease domain-containing protein [Sphingomonas sp. A2-49]MCU6455438.1 DUF86 domain-containing protein [Sphingomonas sp. A2-49]
MSKPLSLDDCLELMRRGIEDVAICTDGVDRERFLLDRTRQLALVKALENIGETAGDVLATYPDFATGERDIPWRAWKNARNRLCHGYHSIDYDLVWSMAQRDVPALNNALQAIADFDHLRQIQGLGGPGRSV